MGRYARRTQSARHVAPAGRLRRTPDRAGPRRCDAGRRGGAAGLARSAVYNYVNDKHDLLFAHAERVITHFVDDLRAAATTGDTVPARLHRYVRGSLRSFASDGGGSDLLPLLTPDEQARLFRLLDPVRDVAMEIVRHGVADGTFPAADPETLARHLSATLEGYRRSFSGAREDLDAQADTITRLLLQGFSGPPPTTGR